METRSLIPLEPSERAIDIGRPLASRTTAREERAFDDEVERAAGRAGGAEAREQRAAEHHAERRAERRAGFREDGSAERGRDSKSASRDAADDDGRQAAGVVQPQDRPSVPHRPGAGGADEAARPGTDETRGAKAPEARPGDGGLAAGDPAASVAAGIGQMMGGTGAGSVAGAAGTGVSAVAGANGAGAAAATAGEAVALADGASRPARDAAGTARAEEARPGRPAPEPPLADAQDVLRQIRLHVVPGISEASLTLVPAHLGRLQVKLQVADGKVGAIVRAESRETLDLLERHLPELCEALGREGLAAGDIQLELGLDRERGGAFDDADGTRGARARHGEASPVHAAADARLAHLIQRLSPNEGGVDTYA